MRKTLTLAFVLFIVILLAAGCGRTPQTRKRPSANLETFWIAEKQLSLGTYQNQDELVSIGVAGNRPQTVTITAELKGITDKEIITTEIDKTVKMIRMKPSLKKAAFKVLRAAREAPLEITIAAANGRTIKAVVIKVKVMPLRDISWNDARGSDVSYQLASWVTPESDRVKELVRTAAKYTPFNAMLGYQEAAGFSRHDVSALQLQALFEALIKDYKMTYINTPVSTGGREAQNVLLPDEVLQKSSGNCIELTVTLASALEAMGMPPYIVLTPGHSLIAVADWPGSNSYIFIETTALSASPAQALALGDAAWQAAREGRTITSVVDVSKLRGYNIHPIR